MGRCGVYFIFGRDGAQKDGDVEQARPMKEPPAWCGRRAGQGREPDGQQGEIRRRTLINGPMELRWRLGRPVPRSLRRNVRCARRGGRCRGGGCSGAARESASVDRSDSGAGRGQACPKPAKKAAKAPGKRRLRRSRKRPLRRSRRAAAKKPKRPPEKARKGCEEVGRRQENKRGDKKRSAAKEHETPRTQGGPRREARQEEGRPEEDDPGPRGKGGSPFPLISSAIERPASASAPLYRGIRPSHPPPAATDPPAPNQARQGRPACRAIGRASSC